MSFKVGLNIFLLVDHRSASADGKVTLEVRGGNDAVSSDERISGYQYAGAVRDNRAAAAGKIRCWTEINMVHNIPQRAGGISVRSGMGP